MKQYMSFKKGLVICDKCKEIRNPFFLFPHKNGLCMLCQECSDEEQKLGNMIEIQSPMEHPNPVHYKFEDIT